REPEGEEHEVEALIEPQPEDVGLDELGLGGIEGERFRVRVHGDHTIRERDELARPDPRAGRELEDATEWRERLDRLLRLVSVAPPALEAVGLELVPASPVPPVVVLGRALGVVALLLGDPVAHAAAASSARKAGTSASES